MYINLKPNILMKHFVKIWLHVILKSVVQFYKYRKKKQKTSFVSFSFLDTPKIMEFPIPGSGLNKITKSIAFSRKLIPFAFNMNKYEYYRESLWIHWNCQRKRCQTIQFISYMNRKLIEKIYIFELGLRGLNIYLNFKKRIM